MEERVIGIVEDSIKRIMDEGITTTNLDHLYKLSKIKHLAKEDKEMYGEYGNYNGRGPGHGSYGNYGDGYGRRGYDRKYRGYDHIDRMGDNYGRYEESRNRYGANNEETLKSLEYMLESVVNFFDMLKSDANSQEEMNMIRKYAQRISQM